MANPYKKLQEKMSPESQKKADKLTGQMLGEIKKIELHLKATKEAGKQAFLAFPQVPADRNPYEHTELLVGDQRIPLGPAWLEAWKDEEELRRPSASDLRPGEIPLD